MEQAIKCELDFMTKKLFLFRETTNKEVTLLNSTWTEEKDQNWAAEPEIFSFLISHIFFLCQNLAPTLSGMQLDCRLFNQRFRCVLLITADVAKDKKQATEVCVTQYLPHFLPFQTCSLQTWLMHKPQNTVKPLFITPPTDICQYVAMWYVKLNWVVIKL